MGRVVVTGGAGFLGSHLCEVLLDRGDEVVAVDNLLTGRVANIEHLFGRAGFTYVEHDVSTYLWVPGEVDAVLHFASPASPADFERIPIQILKVGSLGTHNGLGLAKAKGARFFLASTSEVYGDPDVHPQPETYWGHVNPIGPRGVYDEAKRFAEAMTMAYHRYHGLDTRIVRIFNSILADEQVLYDDGSELRRERVSDLAARVGDNADLLGYAVPSFEPGGAISAAEAIALVGHPTTQQCYEVRTRYGRSIRVTGDHSLFVEGPHGEPVAKTVNDMRVGDRVAIAGRVDLPGRDRPTVHLTDVWSAQGRDPWRLQLRWDGLGDVLTLAEVRRLGLPISPQAEARWKTSGRSAWLPNAVEISDELLWVLGLFVAEGCTSDAAHDGFITISCDQETLERSAKVFERDLNLHVVWSTPSPERARSIAVHSRLLLALFDHLGLPPGRKRIPGWVLGLPLERLRWFIEGYRVGDGVHSGKKLEEGIRHEFSTVSEELKDDLIVAFARFGLVPSVGRYSSTLTHRTGDRRYPFWRLTLPHVRPWSPLEWDEGVEQVLQARRTGDIVWALVKEITPIDATPLVYDFCVPGRENFWAGSGVMAHNTYGPRMRPDDGRAVSNFLVQALQGKPITVYGDGSQTRSFCYVDDEIRGFLALLDGPITGPVNIGNPDEYTILELAEMAIEVTGSSSEIVFEPLPVDDPTQRQPDITIAREQLGWEPTVDLREGLTRTAEYFRARLGL